MSHFREVLRTLRKRARLTQQALAEKAGVDHSYISKMETDDETLPTRDIALKLADALGIRKKTKRWLDFLITAGAARAEDKEGFTLQALSTPLPTTANPSMELSDILFGARAEEIEHLIAAAGLEEDMEELVFDGVVEYTKRLLSAVEMLRKTRKED